MDSIIILAALILNPRARRLRRRMAGEGSNAEASSDPEALSMQVREIGAGCGTVDFTRSTTLNTVIGDNACDTNVDIEKKEKKKEAMLEEDQQR